MATRKGRDSMVPVRRQPDSPIPQWQRVLLFLEHPWFITPLFAVGALVGALFYAPFLVFCGISVVFAFHRVGVVEGKKWWVSGPAYMGLVAVTVAFLYWAGIIIRDSVHLPTASEVAQLVVQKLRTIDAEGPQVQKLPAPNTLPHDQSRPSSQKEERVGTVRLLTEWQKTTLTADLSRYRGQKILLLASSGPEAQSFANDLKVFLSSKDIGWKVEGPIPAPTDQRVMDMQITVNDDYWGKQDPDAALALRENLKFVGIRVRQAMVVDPGVDSDQIALWIGPDSPSGQPVGGFPLSIECRYPTEYSEESTPVSPEIQSKARYGRLVTIGAQKRFKPGDTLHVFFTDPVLYVGAAPTKAVSIDVMGKVMINNEDLRITVKQAFSGPLKVQVVSDRDIKVKCVGLPR